MNKLTVSESMRFSRRDGAWLAAAVLLHGCLLLIPLTKYSLETPEPEILTVALMTSQVPQPPIAEPISEPEVVPLPIEPPAPEPKIASEPLITQQVIQQTEPAPVEEEVPELPTAAALAESARQFKWTIPETSKTRRLGEAPAHQVPPNWLPGIEVESNLFDGMTVPGQTEIVDQWVAVDGSRNVVINTPTGQTLCGRAQAWDPMNPMVEKLMMFRTCGGGGKRTFKMPDRYLKNN